jgi:hypothetical protein
MIRRAMLLLNCTRCDDVVKLVEKERRCECGLTTGWHTDDQLVTGGPHRVLTIDWEVYDGFVEGGAGKIGVRPQAQYRAKGSE